MSSRALFVYGTLRAGCGNRHARLLERSARFLGAARVQARLYRVKWYPGISLKAQPNEWVIGDVFRLHDPTTIVELDHYEGVACEEDGYEGSNEYRRVLTTAFLENGKRVRCWIYEYVGRVAEERRILSGDWKAAGLDHAD